MVSESVTPLKFAQIAQHDDAQFPSEHLHLIRSVGCPVVVLQSKWFPDVSVPENVRQVDPVALITFQSITQCWVVFSSRNSKFPDSMPELASQSPSQTLAERFFSIDLLNLKQKSIATENGLIQVFFNRNDILNS